MEKKITYFEKAGRDNSAACLEIVKRTLADTRYGHLVVATTTGATGLMFSDALKGGGC